MQRRHMTLHVSTRVTEQSRWTAKGARSKSAVSLTSPSYVIRVLSVDGQSVLREGVAAVVNNQPDMRLVAQASTGLEALQQFREHRPDITLMDLRLPGQNDKDALRAIRSEFTNARVIIFTTFDGDFEVQRALRAGACGYLLKNAQPCDLVEAIREVHAGHTRVQKELAARVLEHMGQEALSAREIEVLEQVVSGLRNRGIGERLFISEETVKVHVKHIMEKLGARDRTHAVAIAEKRGILRVHSVVSGWGDGASHWAASA
jgi:DNA-binding NarL/FixJ family response regulator